MHVSLQANVVEAEMQDIGAPERLAGRGRPLAADFAGAIVSSPVLLVTLLKS